jgi:hypothetical protein
MTGLKLARLPDRVPVKISVALQPALKKALDDYALLYARTYGSDEQVADLVPYMLEAFLKADNGFQKGRKEFQEPPSLTFTRSRRAKPLESTLKENGS